MSLFKIRQILFFLMLLSGIVMHAQKTEIHSCFSAAVFYNTSNKGWSSINTNNFLLNGYNYLSYNGTSSVTINNTTSINGTRMQALAQNSSGYLYGIHFVSANNYNIVAYNVNSNYASQIAAANVDFDGSNTIDDNPQAMGINPSGKAWVAGYSVVTGNNYLSYFTTNTNGSVSNIVNNPVIITCDLSAFQVKDMTFDLLGNMFLLVKDMTSSGYYYIYYLASSLLTTPLNGSTITMQKKWRITDEANNDIRYNPKYITWNGTTFDPYTSYECGSLFFDNGGSLVVGVDKMNFFYSLSGLMLNAENYLYKYSYPGNQAQLSKDILLYNYTQNKLSAPISIMEDAATNYYPPFLPLSYISIDALVNTANNSLQVNWTTEAEKNCDHFEVQASSDGQTFKPLGNVKTKGLNGNSTGLLQYNFAATLTKTNFGLFLPGFLLLGFLLFSYHKKPILAIPFFILFIFSCSKKSTEPSFKVEKVFIRIAHIDKDGKTGYSKIVQAVDISGY